MNVIATAFHDIKRTESKAFGHTLAFLMESWNNPSIGIVWPLAYESMLSGKDQADIAFSSAQGFNS